MMNVREQLKAFSLFEGLSDSDLDLVSSLIKVKRVKTGTTIIQEGEIGGELYLLENGIVDVSKTLTIVTSKHDFGTKERSFTRLTGEDHCFFGEMSIFRDKARSATVKAVTECVLLVINDHDFLDLCERYPRIGYVVITNIALLLSEHLRRSNEDVIKLTTALSLALSG
jgi:CRP/FNR family transcriptional regulator, cyclic AMP receptor protein